jgi:hypothetical protein
VDLGLQIRWIPIPATSRDPVAAKNPVAI